MSIIRNFSIPSRENMEQFFNEKFNRHFSPKEQQIVDFFHHQISTALEQNMEESRLQLCATMILMISPQNRRSYCLEKTCFGADEKRNSLAKTIGALFLENIEYFNEIIQKNNNDTLRQIDVAFDPRSDYKVFKKVNDCSNDEKASMKEFCTDYTISLASKIEDLLFLKNYLYGNLVTYHLQDHYLIIQQIDWQCLDIVNKKKSLLQPLIFQILMDLH